MSSLCLQFVQHGDAKITNTTSEDRDQTTKRSKRKKGSIRFVVIQVLDGCQLDIEISVKLDKTKVQLFN
jgi:hypothetical protein